MPGYPAAIERAVEMHVVGLLPDLPGGPGRLLSGTMPDSDVPVVLLKTARFDARAGSPYVDANGEEYGDTALCFAALAHAAVAICAGRTALSAPHVAHANDWHAGLIPLLLRQSGIKNVGTLLTIHNLAIQGNYPIELAPILKLPEAALTPHKKKHKNSGCKRNLQTLFGLPIDPFAPILALVSRITHQMLADVALEARP